MAGRAHPAELDDADLDRLAARIVADVVAAATAATGSGAYDWWKVLFALYPNSKPTHAKRVRDPAVLAEHVTALLAADGWQGPVRPCVFCGAACTVLWAKSTLPMFDSLRAINTLPPRVAGWPVRRSCRLAVWALPYGAWVTAGSATVLTCEAEGVERAFVARHVRRAARIGQFGFEGLASGWGPEAEVLRALRAHADAPAPAVLWTFKNDNQEPWLRVSAIRAGAVGFLHRMPADPDCAAGWSALKRALHRTGSSGEVVLDGATAAARTLFDPDQAPRPAAGPPVAAQPQRRAISSSTTRWPSATRESSNSAAVTCTGCSAASSRANCPPHSTVRSPTRSKTSSTPHMTV